MHLRSVFLLLIFVLCSVFLVVNWEGVMADVSVNLLYTQIQAPLGLILLLGPGLLILVCLIWGFIQQAMLSMELRKVHKQLSQAQDLAQKAELSRYMELKSELQKQILDLQNQASARHSALINAINVVQQEVERNSHETVNSLSASVGEVEDRLTQLVDLASGKQIEVKDKSADSDRTAQ